MFPSERGVLSIGCTRAREERTNYRYFSGEDDSTIMIFSELTSTTLSMMKITQPALVLRLFLLFLLLPPDIALA